MRCSCHIAIGLSCAFIEALASTPVAAEFTDTLVQSRVSADELVTRGYARIGTSPWVSTATGACAAAGCFTYVGMTGATPTRGFLEFQFNEYTCDPAFYSGLFTIMPVHFAGSALTADGFLSLVNAQSGVTGVTAVMAADAANCQGGLFVDWLPADLRNAIVFQWMPPAQPSGNGLSEVFRFAWDFSGLGASESTPVIDGIFAVPTPSALAAAAVLLIAPRSRRRGALVRRIDARSDC
jgi:hypothetical protein